jgi:hypothetical protein
MIEEEYIKPPGMFLISTVSESLQQSVFSKLELFPCILLQLD